MTKRKNTFKTIIVVLVAVVLSLYVRGRILDFALNTVWRFVDDFILNDSFSDLKIGESFYSTIDSYFEKLPQDYCLFVLPGSAGSEATLFKVSDEALDVDLYGGDDSPDFEKMSEDKKIMQGHYIKEYHNNEYLILCEEEKEGLFYYSFKFSSGDIECFDDVNTVYKTFGFNSDEWISVCKTYDEMI